MIKKSDFWFTKNGEKVTLYKIENSSGAYVEMLDYGCTVRSIVVPSRNGSMTDVCLGHDNMESYEKDDAYLGATIGRVANRISGAAFTLGDREYALIANDNGNCLHGGARGFDKFVWDFATQTDTSVTFQRLSPDAEEGFPGNLSVQATFGFSDNNELSIEYRARCDKDTPLNLTNHTYFNLDGALSEDVLDHVLTLNSAFITEIGDRLIPTGRILAVDENLFDFGDDTPFDFTQPKRIGEDINLDDAQLKLAGGYDHNFIIDASGMRTAATLFSEKSGITMTVRTDRPCVQFYSGNFLCGVKGKGGRLHRKHSAVCLETQGFIDAVNRPEFESCILKAGEEFESKTIYAFDSK